MSVIHILVEGKDDLVFVRRLIDIMRGDQGPLVWTLLSPGKDTVTLNSGKFGNAYVKIGRDVVAISETKGFARDPRNFATYIKADEEYPVSQLLVLYDSDCAGSADYGGFLTRLAYLQDERFSKVSVGRKFFLFPDNQKDGTLEDLAIALIRPEVDFVLKDDWRVFRQGIKNKLISRNERYLDDTVKCRIANFCAIFDRETSKDLHWIAALWSDDLWVWDAPVLTPLKDFLRANAPMLFRPNQM